MMLRVKYCGLTRKQDVEAANACRPDYIGFVFAKSRRQINMEQAAVLRKLAEPGIRAGGVFVDAPIGKMVEIARTVPLDVVQLHGRGDSAVIAALREQLPDVQIWQAVRLRQADDLTRAQRLGADRLLIDAFTLEAAGGTGKTADWDLLSQFPAETRNQLFLAGGLNAGNMNEAVERISPFGVDISSGIEAESDGHKDAGKMREVMSIIQRWRENE